MAELLCFHKFWKPNGCVTYTLFLRAAFNCFFKFLLKTFCILSHLKEILFTSCVGILCNRIFNCLISLEPITVILSHSYKGFRFIFFSKFLDFCFYDSNVVSSVSSFINVIIILTSLFIITVNQSIIKRLLSLVIFLFNCSTLLLHVAFVSYYL